ncbi:Keratin, type II cytoskeletal 6A [Apodemus speciosus]|uniref:Keratin, type II cytoskeletal 6A n=1 Tax=Apodemus speciosus TaxID=105296 RepID=A0ABQ0FKY9_APOSI
MLLYPASHNFWGRTSWKGWRMPCRRPNRTWPGC